MHLALISAVSRRNCFLMDVGIHVRIYTLIVRLARSRHAVWQVTQQRRIKEFYQQISSASAILRGILISVGSLSSSFTRRRQTFQFILPNSSGDMNFSKCSRSDLLRPVLKHGLRSLMHVQAWGCLCLAESTSKLGTLHRQPIDHVREV